MSAATEGYSDFVKCIEDGFMEIDNDIVVDLRKQDDSYQALCRQIGDMERDYPFILNVTEDEGGDFFDSRRTWDIGGVFQAQSEERQY